MATGNSTCLLNSASTEMCTWTEHSCQPCCQGCHLHRLHWCRKDASQHLLYLQRPLLEFVWCWRAALLRVCRTTTWQSQVKAKASWPTWESRFVHYVPWTSTSVYSYRTSPFSLWTREHVTLLCTQAQHSVSQYGVTFWTKVKGSCQGWTEGTPGGVEQRYSKTLCTATWLPSAISLL